MKRILVTGATGFLGKRICSDLIDQGYSVLAQGRNKSIGEDLIALGCDFISLDLRSDISTLTDGIHTIIHSAALSSPWGAEKDFIDINYIATKNLIQNAISSKVQRFIYISSTSVYFNFKDRFNIKETDPVASPSPSQYTKTKLMAENCVLENKNNIETIIIRPRGIFGPGDTTLIPRLVNAHDRGKLRVIGSRKTMVDVTYVGNVSHASILSITSSKESIGQIYNITNGEPVKVWEMIKTILTRLGRDLNEKEVPFKLVFWIAYLSELFCSLPFIKKEPTLTRYTVGLLAKSQTLDISKAKELLNYTPIKNMDEALEETLKWYLKEN